MFLRTGNDSRFFCLKAKTFLKMKTKHLAVPTTAPAPIGADPIDEFIKALPRKAEILRAKETRTAEKSVIYVEYKFEGRLCRAICGITIESFADADVEVLYQEGGAA